jgi:hypothetical protein
LTAVELFGLAVAAQLLSVMFRRAVVAPSKRAWVE